MATNKLSAALKLLKLALASTSIGLIVVALGALVTGLSKSQKALDWFERKLSGLKAVFAVIGDRCIALADTLMDAIEKPGQAWDGFTKKLKAGFDFIKDQVFDRFTASFTIASKSFSIGVLKMQKAWLDFTDRSKEAEKINEKIRSMEHENAQASAKINQANQGVLSVAVKVRNAIGGINEEMKQEKKLTEELQRILQQTRVEHAKLSAKTLADEEKISQLRLKAKDLTKTEKERKQFLLQAPSIERKNSAERLELIKKELAAKAGVNIATEKGLKKFEEINEKIKQKEISPEDIGLDYTHTKGFEDYLSAHQEYYRVRKEHNESQRSLAKEINSIDKESAASSKQAAQEQARVTQESFEKKMKASQAALALYLLETQNIDSSLSE